MSYPNALEELLDDIHDWQVATFPKADAQSKFKHLEKEIIELSEDVSNKGELADCLFLLLGMCSIQGYKVFDLLRDKLQVNKARTWGEPDVDGVVEHVRPCRKCGGEMKPVSATGPCEMIPCMKCSVCGWSVQ